MRADEREFHKLWLGQSVSLVGSQFTLLALPLLATLRLSASAGDMGVLNALQWLPGIACGLLAGVVADRLSRRRLMLVADVARAAALLLIPLAELCGQLSLQLVDCVAVATSIGTVFFGAASPALVPSLVARERLATAGGRMMASQSLAATVGPGLGGAVVQAIGAAFAIAVDALSFLVSAVSLAVMRVDEDQKAPAVPAIWPEVRHAFDLIARDPVLRAVVVGSAVFNLFAIMRTTVYVLSVTRDLGLSPVVLGLTVAASGPSSIVASLGASRVMRHLGIGPTIILGLGMIAGSFGSAPLAGLHPSLAVPILLAGQGLLGAGLALGHVPFGVLVQVRVPNDSLGRVWATLRVLFDCAIPVGALVGGALGSYLGLSTTQVVATIGCLLAVGFLAYSPVRSIQESKGSCGME